MVHPRMDNLLRKGTTVPSFPTRPYEATALARGLLYTHLFRSASIAGTLESPRRRSLVQVDTSSDIMSLSITVCLKLGHDVRK